jgi:hypothetical protein
VTDVEYTRTITGIDCKLINQLTKVLEDKGFDVDEYLTWLFDDFLSENPKFNPATIKFACGNFAVEKFLYENREKVKQRKEALIRQKESMDLITRARVLIREYAKDEGVKKNIVESLQEFRKTGIIEKLRVEIERLERDLRNSQLKQEATRQEGDSNGSV